MNEAALPPPLVHIVDDEENVRRSVQFVLRIAGFSSALYASAEEFLEKADLQRPGCIILDVRMPGMNGMELQQRLAGLGCELPVLFLTGHGDIDMAVTAMKRGAADFMQKPTDPPKLQAVVKRMVERSIEGCRARLAVEESRRLFSTLTSREQSVVLLVAQGKLNKLIAAELGISEQTVKIHRLNALRKIGCKSAVDVAEFLRAAHLEEAS